MKKRFIPFICVFLIFVCIVSNITFAFAEQTTQYNYYEIAKAAINAKNADMGNSGDVLFALSDFAGTTAADWYAIALSRLECDCDYAAYFAMLKRNIIERYNSDGALSTSKSTEWHRAIICVLAMGENARSVGVTDSGKAVDLVADGIFYRKALGKQGINGYIWALIALNSKSFDEPNDAINTRQSIINCILDAYIAQNGWSQNGAAVEADITAMAITALAPYYNAMPKVKAAVDSALEFLSKSQLITGDFISAGSPNAESTAQVIIALCSLNINPQTDKRFNKQGKSPVDGLMRYLLPGGGFTHCREYDKNSPEAKPGEFSSMACEQALCALSAVIRFNEQKASFYDFSDIKEAAKQGFSAEQVNRVFLLPDAPDTSYTAEVAVLISAAENSEFTQKDECLARLYETKAKITELQNNIDKTNAAVRQSLYPFDEISLFDALLINKTVSFCNSLSEYDKAKIECFEDVLKAKAKTDSYIRTIVVFTVLILVAFFMCVFTAKSVRKKINRKQTEISELRQMYCEDDE